MTRRVVVDAQDHALETSGGIGRYVSLLVAHLRQPAVATALGADVEVARVAPSPEPVRSRRDRLLAAARAGSRRVASAVGRRLGRRGPPAASPGPPALLHEVSNHAAHPALGRWALEPRLRLVVTAVDLLDVHFPEQFTDAGLLTRQGLHHFYRGRADLLLAISEFTRRGLIERLGVDPARIQVVPLAGRPPGAPAPGDEARARGAALGRFALYPARAWPHKNHARLLEAAARAAPDLARGGLRLVLAGGLSPEERRGLLAARAALRLERQVVVLGFVSEVDYAALLEAAELLVFPSLFEGFGMPLIEAMEAGCPVAAARAGAIPEVVGDAAELFDPTDVDAIADLLRRAADGRLDRSGLAARGRTRAGAYSWDRTLTATVGAYRALLER